MKKNHFWRVGFVCIVLALLCIPLDFFPGGSSADGRGLFDGLVTTPVPTPTPDPTPTPTPAPVVTPAPTYAPVVTGGDTSGLDPMLLTLLGTPSVYPGNGCTTYVFQIHDAGALLPAMTVLDMDALLSFHFDRTSGLFTLVLSGGATPDPSDDSAINDGPAPTSRPRPTDGPVETECFYCEGLGECAECEGTGYVQCETCFGSGDCETCGGLGYRDTISHGEYVQKDCSACRGSSDCRKCGGNGEVKCGTCRGNGECTKCGGDGYR